MENLLKLLQNFFYASSTPVFIFNHDNKEIARFTSILTPNFPKKYLDSIIDLTAQNANLYVVSENEYFSVIGMDFSKPVKIIIWSNIRTIRSTGFYEDTFPGISLKKLRSLTYLLYYSLFQTQTELQCYEMISDTVFTSSTEIESPLETTRSELDFQTRLSCRKYDVIGDNSWQFG